MKKPYEKTSQQKGIAFVQQGAEKVDKQMKSVHPTNDLSNKKCNACEKVANPACSCPNIMDEDHKKITGVNYFEVAEEVKKEKNCLKGMSFLPPTDSKELSTLDWWKLYLDSCATCNQVFVTTF